MSSCSPPVNPTRHPKARSAAFAGSLLLEGFTRGLCCAARQHSTPCAQHPKTLQQAHVVGTDTGPPVSDKGVIDVSTWEPGFRAPVNLPPSKLRKLHHNPTGTLQFEAHVGAQYVLDPSAIPVGLLTLFKHFLGGEVGQQATASTTSGGSQVHVPFWFIPSTAPDYPSSAYNQ